MPDGKKQKTIQAARARFPELAGVPDEVLEGLLDLHANPPAKSDAELMLDTIHQTLGTTNVTFVSDYPAHKFDKTEARLAAYDREVETPPAGMVRLSPREILELDGERLMIVRMVRVEEDGHRLDWEVLFEGQTLVKANPYYRKSRMGQVRHLNLTFPNTPLRGEFLTEYDMPDGKTLSQEDDHLVYMVYLYRPL